MGEVLHKVDFDQLEIENKQYLEKIDQRNTDLLALKLMSTRTNGVLIKYKVLLVSEKEKAKKKFPKTYLPITWLRIVKQYIPSMLFWRLFSYNVEICNFSHLIYQLSLEYFDMFLIFSF